ncbi:MAG: hypothetical protein O3B22_00930 [Proteobacteria bacterium]|nr:hypothetical protein [Pseudomonadota bacterium]
MHPSKALAALVLLLVLMPGESRAECRQSFDLGLTEIAGIPHQRTIRFDDPGLGVQFRFFAPGAAGNLSYIRFDMGHATVDAEIEAASREQIWQNIKIVADLNGVAIQGPARLDPYPAGDVVITNDIFLGWSDDAVAVEFLGLGHDRNCLHEIRFTIVVPPQADEIDAARSLYREILRTLAPYIETD